MRHRDRKWGWRVIQPSRFREKESMSTSQSNKWMLLAPLGVIVALIAIAWGVSKFLGGVLPEEKQTTYTQPSSPAPRLVRFPATPNNTTPRPVARKTAKKGTKPKEREWVGKPSKLPPHAELMARANKKYRVNPNAPKLPKPGSQQKVQSQPQRTKAPQARQQTLRAQKSQLQALG